VTQRAAVLSKDVLTQVEVLVALRTIAPQDRAAIDAWIQAHDAHGQREEFMASLASLPIGTAWFWSPGWLDVFKRVKVRARTTFDSSATPAVGAKAAAPKKLADVDLEQLKTRIAATIEKAKAEDPRALRAEIARLKGELAKSPTRVPAGKTKTIEIEVVKPATVKAIERAIDRCDAAIARVNGLVVNLKAHVEAAQARGAELGAARDALVGELRALRVGRSASPRMDAVRAQQRGSTAAQILARPTAIMVSRRAGPGDPALPRGERQVLTAIAQHHDGVTREQLTVLTGYKRSTRDAYVQRAGERGHVEIADDRIRATQAGMNALGADFEPLPTGDALRAHWLARLPDGERRVLEEAIRVYPKPIEREAISEATGYKRSTRDAYLQRLAARRLVVTERGQVRASEELFG
jgi:hypothetical protein